MLTSFGNIRKTSGLFKVGCVLKMQQESKGKTVTRRGKASRVVINVLNQKEREIFCGQYTSRKIVTNWHMYHIQDSLL